MVEDTDDESDDEPKETAGGVAREGRRIVFRAIAGFEPPTMEMAVEGAE